MICGLWFSTDDSQHHPCRLLMPADQDSSQDTEYPRTQHRPAHSKSPSARGRFFWPNIPVLTDFAVNAKSWVELHFFSQIRQNVSLPPDRNILRLKIMLHINSERAARQIPHMAVAGRHFIISPQKLLEDGLLSTVAFCTGGPAGGTAGAA